MRYINFRELAGFDGGWHIWPDQAYPDDEDSFHAVLNENIRWPIGTAYCGAYPGAVSTTGVLNGIPIEGHVYPFRDSRIDSLEDFAEQSLACPQCVRHIENGDIFDREWLEENDLLQEQEGRLPFREIGWQAYLLTDWFQDVDDVWPFEPDGGCPNCENPLELRVNSTRHRDAVYETKVQCLNCGWRQFNTFHHEMAEAISSMPEASPRVVEVHELPKLA